MVGNHPANQNVAVASNARFIVECEDDLPHRAQVASNEEFAVECEASTTPICTGQAVAST